MTNFSFSLLSISAVFDGVFCKSNSLFASLLLLHSLFTDFSVSADLNSPHVEVSSFSVLAVAKQLFIKCFNYNNTISLTILKLIHSEGKSNNIFCLKRLIKSDREHNMI